VQPTGCDAVILAVGRKHAARASSTTGNLPSISGVFPTCRPVVIREPHWRGWLAGEPTTLSAVDLR